MTDNDITDPGTYQTRPMTPMNQTASDVYGDDTGAIANKFYSSKTPINWGIIGAVIAIVIPLIIFFFYLSTTLYSIETKQDNLNTGINNVKTELGDDIKDVKNDLDGKITDINTKITHINNDIKDIKHNDKDIAKELENINSHLNK